MIGETGGPTLAATARIGQNPVTVLLTQHAIGRFNQRVRPTLDEDQAGAELRRLVCLGTISATAPRWLAETQHQAAAMYLVVGDVVIPLDPPARTMRPCAHLRASRAARFRPLPASAGAPLAAASGPTGDRVVTRCSRQDEAALDVRSSSPDRRADACVRSCGWRSPLSV
jgi:hypothetical protein